MGVWCFPTLISRIRCRSSVLVSIWEPRQVLWRFWATMARVIRRLRIRRQTSLNNERVNIGSVSRLERTTFDTSEEWNKENIEEFGAVPSHGDKKAWENMKKIVRNEKLDADRNNLMNFGSMKLSDLKCLTAEISPQIGEVPSRARTINWIAS